MPSCHTLTQSINSHYWERRSEVAQENLTAPKHDYSNNDRGKGNANTNTNTAPNTNKNKNNAGNNKDNSRTSSNANSGRSNSQPEEAKVLCFTV